MVLTDVSMPGMDGVALIEALRKLEPGLSVIAASGRGSSGKSAELEELEIDAFLAKPYTAETLIAALHELLSPKGRILTEPPLR